MNKYIKEVDLLGDDIAEKKTPKDTKGVGNKASSDIDLLDIDVNSTNKTGG